MTLKEFHDWLSNAGFCGCGQPASAIHTIKRTLAAMKTHDNRITNLNKALPDEGSQHIVLYWLDHNGVIEHGGSVGGGWLTDLGEQMLSLLESLNDSEIVALADN